MGFLRRLANLPYKQLPDGRRAFYPRYGRAGYILNAEIERRFRRLHICFWIGVIILFGLYAANIVLGGSWHILLILLYQAALFVCQGIIERWILRDAERTTDIREVPAILNNVQVVYLTLILMVVVGVPIGLLWDPWAGLGLACMIVGLGVAFVVLLLALASEAKGKPAAPTVETQGERPPGSL